MKILIIEAFSAGNIGSGALVENSIYLLKENFHKVDIEILAQNPKSIQKLTGLPNFHEMIILPLRQSRIRQICWLLKTGLWMAAHAVALKFSTFPNAALRPICSHLPFDK